MGAQTPPGLSDEKAARIMAGLREGRTLRPFAVKASRFDAYCETHPDYAREAKALLPENLKASNARKGAARRALTHCKYGHPLSGNNLYLAPGRKERKCWTCINRRDKSPRPPNQEQIPQVTAAFNAGKTVKQICWGTVGNRKIEKPILTFRKLRLHRELNPEFNRFVVSAMADHNSKGQLRRFNPDRARANIRRSETNDFHKIVNMVPVYLPPDVRDDIAQSILVALLEGALQRDQVKVRVQQFVTAHNREANKHGTGKYGLRSIDAAAFVDSSTTFGDTISRGLWN